MMRKRHFVMVCIILLGVLFLSTFNTIALRGKVSGKIINPGDVTIDTVLTKADLEWVACDHDRNLAIPFTPQSRGGYTYDQNDTHLHVKETTDTYQMYVGWYSSFSSINGSFTLQFEGKAKSENQEATRLALIIYDNDTKAHVDDRGYIGSGTGLAETDFIPFETEFSYPGVTDFILFFEYSDGFTQYHNQEFWVRNLLISFGEEDLDPPVITPCEDLEYVVGSANNYISWILEDDNPGFYELYRDGTQLTGSPAWADGQNLSFNVDLLPVGVYNYTIVAIDVYENRASSTIWVTVVEPEKTSFGLISLGAILVIPIMLKSKRMKKRF